VNILVLGDMIVDIYEWYTATRVCPEAPALVLERKFKSHEHREGGAALVANNLRSLAGECNITAFYGSKSFKRRIFADRTLLCRIDDDSQQLISPERYARSIELVIDQMEAIVVSDYGKGAIVGDAVIKVLLQAHLRCPIFVDAKIAPDRYAGFFALFPNEHEPAPSGKFRHVIRKLGSRGANVDGVDVPTAEQHVYDVTGAGDVFLAAFVASYSTLRTQVFDDDHEMLRQCAVIANRAAGISVRHLGTHVVTPEEMEAEVSLEKESV
jgi:D-beta-D-heptose 7-phosphate kinase/D-beta-D-heptose 1-phosphate adenosyltransferase